MSQHEKERITRVPAHVVSDVVPELTDDQLESVSGGRLNSGGPIGIAPKAAPKQTNSWLAQEPGGQGLEGA